MSALQTVTAYDEPAPREPIRAWLEGRDGSIVRGLVDVLSQDGAVVLLTDLDSLRAHDEVTVRLSFHRSAPTLAAHARVLWVRAQDGTFECEVAWAPGPEHARLSSFIATLG